MLTNPLDILREKLAERRGAAAKPSRPDAASHATHARRRRQPFLARLVNQWWTRLLSAIYQGSLSEQEEEYESHSTSRDYVWNTAGMTIWGMSLPRVRRFSRF